MTPRDPDHADPREREGRMRLLRSALEQGPGLTAPQAFGEHLTDELAACVAEGTLLPRELDLVEAHLDACASCATRVAQRRGGAAPARPASATRVGPRLMRLWLPLAAAAVLVAGTAWKLIPRLFLDRARAELIACLDRGGPDAGVDWWRERGSILAADPELAPLFREPEFDPQRGSGDSLPVDLLAPVGPVDLGRAVRLVWLDIRRTTANEEVELVVDVDGSSAAPVWRLRSAGTEAVEFAVATPAPIGARLRQEASEDLARIVLAAPPGANLHVTLLDGTTGERLDEAFFRRDERTATSIPSAATLDGSMFAALRRARDLTDRAVAGAELYVEAVESWAPVRARFPADRLALRWLEALHARFGVEPLRAAARAELDRAPPR